MKYEDDYNGRIGENGDCDCDVGWGLAGQQINSLRIALLSV